MSQALNCSAQRIDWAREARQKRVLQCFSLLYERVFISLLILERESKISRKSSLTGAAIDAVLNVCMCAEPYFECHYFGPLATFPDRHSLTRSILGTRLCRLCCCFSCSATYSWRETSIKVPFYPLFSVFFRVSLWCLTLLCSLES